MDRFFTDWFPGLDKGLERLSEEQCGELFLDCARRCSRDALKYLYRDLVAEIYGQLPPEAGSDRDLTLQEMTEEADPLFTQLPDELSRRQRARILREYYGELLAGARKLNNY